MIRYQFSGHLSPRPKGTENSMCALSGEVYLAADVDAWKAEREHSHVNELTRLNAKIAALHAKNRDLTTKLRELRRAPAGKTTGEVTK